MTQRKPSHSDDFTLLACLSLMMLMVSFRTEAAAVAWGANYSGQIGDNTTVQRNDPVAVVEAAGVLMGKTVTQIAAGGQHTCAVTSEGKAYCWGENEYGRLGNGKHRDPVEKTPVEVMGELSGKTVTQISGGDDHTCAIASGKAYCWGKGGSGQVGNGTYSESNLTVIEVAGLLQGKTVTQISAGSRHTCAVASGKAYCWGSDNRGQLGNGAADTNGVPVAVTEAAGLLEGKTVTQISAGGSHTCAVASGKAYCWGEGFFGPLGNGSTNDKDAPVAVTEEVGLLSGKTVTSIAAGNTHTCAVASGKAYCWGQRNNGRLGDGGTTSGNQSTPVAVAEAAGVLQGKTVTQIDASYEYSCAITSEGKVYCWGGDGDGGLGNGATGGNQSMPVAVTDSGVLNGKTVTQLSLASDGGHTVVLAVTLPAAPTGLAATAGDGQLSISFTAGAAGEAAISNYKFSTDDGATYTAFDPAVTASPVTISGLTNGTTYKIKLRATNVLGDGAESVAVDGTPAIPVINGTCGTANTVATSGAPTALCTAGTGNTPTSSNGAWGWICTGSGPGATNATCSAPYQSQTLSFGTAPTLVVDSTGTVSAQSTSGLKPVLSSITSSACTLGTTANNATGVEAVVIAKAAGTNNCSVLADLARSANGCTTCFLAATQMKQDIGIGKGAQSISNFTAPVSLIAGSSSPSGTLGATQGASSSALVFSSLSTRVCTVSGNVVTAVTSGTCTVAADQATDANYNAAAQLTRTLTVTAVSGVTPPAAPTGLVASAGDGRITVSFRAPTMGAPIVNYEYSLDGGAFVTPFPAVNESPVVIAKLNNGTLYSLTLRAVNSAGAGAASTAVTATPQSNAAIEDAVEPPTRGGVAGDGNGDGTPDKNQNHVASLPNAAGQYVTLVTDNGTTITDVAAVARPADFPAFPGFAHSGIAFTANGLAPGGTTQIELFFSTRSGVGRLAKKNRTTGNYDVLDTRSRRVGDKTRVTFEIKDGGPYDSDGLENGEVVDPVFPLDEEGSGTHDDGFLGLGAVNPLMLVLLGLLGLRRRKA